MSFIRNLKRQFLLHDFVIRRYLAASVILFVLGLTLCGWLWYELRSGHLGILIVAEALGVFIAITLHFLILARAKKLVYNKREEIQSAKDELLALASHQLRTPATVVKQFVGMVLEGYTGKLTAPQKEMLSKAYEGNERQLEIINQILQVSKIDAERLTLVKKPFDLNDLTEQIVAEQTKIANDYSQTIEFLHGQQKLKVKGDSQYVRMALENIIDNAIKYSYAGSKITVQTGLRKGRAFTAVTDRGVAIKQSDIPKLFNKFTRLDNELSVQAGGSGIGLYLARQIALRHNGNIEVKSRMGKGSTFTLYLPAKS